MAANTIRNLREHNVLGDQIEFDFVYRSSLTKKRLGRLKARSGLNAAGLEHRLRSARTKTVRYACILTRTRRSLTDYLVSICTFSNTRTTICRTHSLYTLNST